MSVLQIIAICVLGAGTLVALGFLAAFIIVSCSKEKDDSYVPVKEEDDEVNEIDLDAMLAKLEEISSKKVVFIFPPDNSVILQFSYLSKYPSITSYNIIKFSL